MQKIALTKWLSVVAVSGLLYQGSLAWADDERCPRLWLRGQLTQKSQTASDIARFAPSEDGQDPAREFAKKAEEISADSSTLASRVSAGLDRAEAMRTLSQLISDASELVRLAGDGPAQSKRRWRHTQAENLYTTSMQLRVMCADANWNATPSPQRAAAPSGPSAMDAAAFAGLQTAVRQQTFDDGKVSVIRQAAKANWFTAQQLVSTLDLIKFSTGKIDAAVAMWPHLIDRENAHLVFAKFGSSDQGALRKRVGE